jgi:hypothetical protein
MASPEDFPTPQDVADDLAQLVHDLSRWNGLPLRALRLLPSIRFWTPPRAVQARFEGKPARDASNAAIVQRIMEAIGETAIESDQQQLASLFSFHHPERNLTTRRQDAADARGVTPDSFRKNSEGALLRAFSEELFQRELAWAVSQLESRQESVDQG